jgi:hypothetical protein
LRAFDTHEIVMFGEAHGCKQEYEWLKDLVGTPEFADRVDDIVVEGGNSLYQQSVDRYIAGEDVPFEQVQQAWRNAIGELGAPSPGGRIILQDCACSQPEASWQASNADRARGSAR